MLDNLIKFSLRNRLIILSVAVVLLFAGYIIIKSLPVDVLPDLNRPRVTIFLEANGMAPEEIETQVVLPVETALNGAPGVEVVRSNSGIGIGMVFVEFDWDTDIFRARQLVAEKLATVQLPPGITPVMGPISSVMGQIMIIGISADSTTNTELRTLADFTIRRRLLTIPGIAQVIPMGGEKLQYQVHVSSARMKQFNLTIDEVTEALVKSGSNGTGGFIDRFGSETNIRIIGRATSLEDLRATVVGNQDGLPVLLSQVADVSFGGAVKRGDASINGKPAVVLTVEKQPGASTVDLTYEVDKVLHELQGTLPPDVKINSHIFRQSNFIENSISNVEEALRDGFILVIIILFLFLNNFRTTLITLTAIPISIVITAGIFKLFGISINTLTLGGIAVAIGELVDDAIVDVENVYRRLKENREKENPENPVKVVFEASSEIRNSIVYATVIVVLVFLPLFFMQGMEGRIFAPLGIAYITSILASLLVSLTVTPALCTILLTKQKPKEERDSRLVRYLKRKDTSLLKWAFERPRAIIGVATILFVFSALTIPFFGTEFLPPFNEGSFTINLSTPPGTSLNESNKIGVIAEKLILRVPEVEYVTRRTGRAELDEHVEPVSNSEIDVQLKENITRSRDEIVNSIRKELSFLKGVTVNVGQPISHRLDHLLSGVRAQVAIKIFGSELNELRTQAGKISSLLEEIDGVVDVQVERQVMVPQLLITIRRDALKRFNIQPGKVAEDLEIFFNGKITSQILDEQKIHDVILRIAERERSDTTMIKNTLISTGDNNLIPLHQIAKVEFTSAMNSVSHENTQRKITVSCNVDGRDLGSTVEEIKKRINEDIHLPQGYYVDYGGQFKSTEEASALLLILGFFSLAGIFMVLYHHFHSPLMVLQVMLNIPFALIGSVIAVMLTGGVFSVATLVGFITLTGIASRNGIMMISHYIYIIENENEKFSNEMIIRGSLERMVPVLMTALTAALALIPLTLDSQAAGKEILYPVATVILGGLISSTILDIIVTPVVFKLYGERALKTYFENKKKYKDLDL